MSATLFGEHIALLTSVYESALQVAGTQGGSLDAVLLHSGSEQTYFGDDRHIQFQAFGHFNHWLPVNRPDQFIWFEPGRTPVYLQVIPYDFWYEQTVANESWWAGQFDIVRLTDLGAVADHLGHKRTAYLGPNSELAGRWGFEVPQINPQRLLAYLDFHRAIKSHYELEQLRHASKLGVQGHRAARHCFLQGGNEYQIHMAFLNACEILEQESPYTNIVALDEKAAILHYQNKRRGNEETGQVLLIDAGCRINGYCSDITRTTVKDSAHPVFQSLVSGMEDLERGLVELIRPGKAYVDLQEMALRGVANLLVNHEISHENAESLYEQDIAQWFMPHGVGHLLGLQVHDVGGHQKNENGGTVPPPKDSPSLRNTRTMANNMVFTVEPGLYFIPMILEDKRQSANGKLINWALIDELYPCGGIRIEDNVRVMDTAAENLTRQFEN